MLIYFGIKGDLPLLVPDNTNLVGGKAGSKPQITITEIRKGSNNLLYEPIPNDMIFQPADTPQVLV